MFSTQPLEPLGETTGALKDATRINPTDRSKIDAAKIVAAWMSSPVAMGDLSLEISKLKSQPGKYILAHGGASFAQALVKTGQIDEYHLLIHPVALGRGLLLFSPLPEPMYLKVARLEKFGSGAMGVVYHPA